MASSSHKLSLIIPAYKQEKTIVQDVRRIKKVLSELRYVTEIIVVVDGYSDKTYAKLKKASMLGVKVATYMRHLGKGHAVRYGMRLSSGDYVAFIDAGMEIDPNGISMLLEHMEWYDADIILASKRHPASIVEYPWQRRVLSLIHQVLAWVLFHLKVRDTQAGLKIYRKKVLQKILPRLLEKRYAFDLEMLAVANHFGFKRIYEAPIRLRYNFKALSNAATIRGIIMYCVDVLAIYYRLYIRKYYDNSHS